MAVGDLIVYLADNPLNYTTFQPAVGVELILTSVSGGNNMALITIDGTWSSWNTIQSSANFNMGANIKAGVTNTNYIQLYTPNYDGSFTAIQMK
jgi:hypothetical protein